MKPLTLRIHPAVLVAVIVLVPGAGMALTAHTTLNPPVSISGNVTTSALRVTQINPSHPAIFGEQTGSSAGVLGENNASKGVGVQGQSNDGTGVVGLVSGLSGGDGVSGKTGNPNASGVYGTNSYTASTNYNSIGVEGYSVAGYGVYGSGNRAGAYGISGFTNGVGMYGYGQNAAHGVYGNVSGTGYAGLFHGPVYISGGLTVSGGCSGCAIAGTGRLVAGVAVVRFARSRHEASTTFTATVTPLGDSNGLYIAQKLPGAFVVRENHAGRSMVAFDYRVVLDERLPPFPQISEPTPAESPGLQSVERH